MEGPVDILIFGIGHPGTDYHSTRFNAGMTFADYFANCVAMQKVLINTGETEPVTVPTTFTRPVFVRRVDLLADVYDSILELTEDDLKEKRDGNKKIAKQIRVVIAKPIVDPTDAAHALHKVMGAFPVKDPLNQLIVSYGDTSVLEGCISLQNGPDVKGVDKNKQIKGIITHLRHSNFIRLRMGLGLPEKGSDDSYLLQVLTPSKEMDRFGHALDLSGQAMQHLASFQDFKQTKKKFTSSKKLPNELRQLPGIIFPVDTIEATNDS